MFPYKSEWTDGATGDVWGTSDGGRKAWSQGVLFVSNGPFGGVAGGSEGNVE